MNRKGYENMKQEIHIPENLALHELMTNQHGLFGEVTIHRRNKQTGETTFWYQDHNIIPISGMQWILMKMFGLYLDTPHGVSYEELGKDTTLVIPELNQDSVMGIGTLPKNYTTMEENISSAHIVQGFMVGNGGSGEDQLTTKNTDYSFINLRNPIPFQQTQGTLPGDIAGKYMGKLQTGSSSYAKSYYIKKFDDTPHIYHSWWRDGQRWDYVDPVTPSDLGPDAANGAGKTNRIETYVECKLTIDEDDFQSYFSHDGNNQTAAINELGLVAFDRSATGDLTTMELLYRNLLKPIINIVFAYSSETGMTEAEIQHLHDISDECANILGPLATKYDQTQLGYLAEQLTAFASNIANPSTLTPEQLGEAISTIQGVLSSADTISVIAYYDQYGTYKSEQDSYMEILSEIDFDTNSVDEAQRIKLITYYTFKSIPIEENWETVINYRIYAN